MKLKNIAADRALETFKKNLSSQSHSHPGYKNSNHPSIIKYPIEATMVYAP
jgi:hypothetical protein